MDRTERQKISNAIKLLNGRLQSHVNRRTTHVILGSCHRSDSPDRRCSGISALNVTKNNNTMHTRSKTMVNRNNNNVTDTSDKRQVNTSDKNMDTSSKNANDVLRVVNRSDTQKARTLNALLGAARGCRVLYAQWVLDSLEAKQWLHHNGYEVPHLKKISQVSVYLTCCFSPKAKLHSSCIRKVS